MRYIRLLHFLYLGLLIILDLILSTVYHQFPFLLATSSNLALIGLIVLSKTEAVTNTILKGLVLALVWDLLHIQSFPIFMISITLSLLFAQSWNRHIGSSTLEIMVQSAVTLFLKQSIIWLLLPLVKGISISYFPDFMQEYILWTVLINMLWVPFVLWLNAKMHRLILQSNQNYRLK